MKDDIRGFLRVLSEQEGSKSFDMKKEVNELTLKAKFINAKVSRKFFPASHMSTCGRESASGSLRDTY